VYAEKNGIGDRFNRKKKTPEWDWVISFCKRQNLSIRRHEKYSLGRIIGFNKVQAIRGFEKFVIYLKSIKPPPPPPNRIFNVRKSGITTAPNKVP
jgi:hypothetical protein